MIAGNHKIFVTVALKSITFFFFLPVFSFAGQTQHRSQHPNDSVEITRTDLTGVSYFNGSHATVFGIALGMGRTELRQKIKKYPYFKLKEDAFNPKRFYLTDISNDSRVVNLAYFIWPNYDSGLYQIVLYPPMSKYMKGLSSDIVSPACVDHNSEIYKFLAEPSARNVSLDMPDLKTKTTQLYYPKYNIVIEESTTSSGTQYNLVLTHKW